MIVLFPRPPQTRSAALPSGRASPPLWNPLLFKAWRTLLGGALGAALLFGNYASRSIGAEPPKTGASPAPARPATEDKTFGNTDFNEILTQFHTVELPEERELYTLAADSPPPHSSWLKLLPLEWRRYSLPRSLFAGSTEPLEGGLNLLYPFKEAQPVLTNPQTSPSDTSGSQFQATPSPQPAAVSWLLRRTSKAGKIGESVDHETLNSLARINQWLSQGVVPPAGEVLPVLFPYGVFRAWSKTPAGTQNPFLLTLIPKEKPFHPLRDGSDKHSTLLTLLNQSHSITEPVRLSEFALDQSIKGLSFIQQGQDPLIHGDFKFDNLIETVFNGARTLQIIDWDSVRFLSELVRPVENGGTPEFAPPERLLRIPSNDPATADLFDHIQGQINWTFDYASLGASLSEAYLSPSTFAFLRKVKFTYRKPAQYQAHKQMRAKKYYSSNESSPLQLVIGTYRKLGTQFPKDSAEQKLWLNRWSRIGEFILASLHPEVAVRTELLSSLGLGQGKGNLALAEGYEPSFLKPSLWTTPASAAPKDHTRAKSVEEIKAQWKDLIDHFQKNRPPEATPPSSSHGPDSPPTSEQKSVAADCIPHQLSGGSP